MGRREMGGEGGGGGGDADACGCADGGTVAVGGEWESWDGEGRCSTVS